MHAHSSRVGKNGSKTVTLSQARKGRAKSNSRAAQLAGQAKAPGVVLDARTAEQIAKEEERLLLSGRYFPSDEDIDLHIPGLLLEPIPDNILLGFVSAVVVNYADALLKRVLSKSESLYWECCLAQSVNIARALNSHYFGFSTAAEADAKLNDRPASRWLPGLARLSNCDLRSVLYCVCHAIHRHAAVIEREIIMRLNLADTIGALEWYQTLLACEAVVARGEGWNRDDREGPHPSEELRRAVMECEVRCAGAWPDKRRAACRGETRSRKDGGTSRSAGSRG